MFARIDRVDDQSVRLDFNHPLAGKELHFSVKVVGLREATAEEVAHGHVHGPGHSH
jgi:FKBP-type peptidyl-prolyl cis-trans isomerase SlyD